MLPNDSPEYREGAPLPGFRPVSDALRAVPPALSPPSRISVSEAATCRKVIAGGHWTFWDNAVAPYMGGLPSPLSSYGERGGRLQPILCYKTRVPPIQGNWCSSVSAVKFRDWEPQTIWLGGVQKNSMYL